MTDNQIKTLLTNKREINFYTSTRTNNETVYEFSIEFRDAFIAYLFNIENENIAKHLTNIEKVIKYINGCLDIRDKDFIAISDFLTYLWTETTVFESRELDMSKFDVDYECSADRLYDPTMSTDSNSDYAIYTTEIPDLNPYVIPELDIPENLLEDESTLEAGYMQSLYHKDELWRGIKTAEGGYVSFSDDFGISRSKTEAKRMYIKTSDFPTERDFVSHVDWETIGEIRFNLNVKKGSKVQNAKWSVVMKQNYQYHTDGNYSTEDTTHIADGVIEDGDNEVHKIRIRRNSFNDFDKASFYLYIEADDAQTDFIPFEYFKENVTDEDRICYKIFGNKLHRSIMYDLWNHKYPDIKGLSYYSPCDVAVDGIYVRRRDIEKEFIIYNSTIEFVSVSRNFLIGTDNIDELAMQWYGSDVDGKLSEGVKSVDLGM